PMTEWCRLPQDPWHRQVTLKTSVDFRVDSLASSPADIVLAAEFDKAGPFPSIATEDLRNLCVKWLPRFYDSSFFDQIYWRARSRTPLPPPDSLFQDLRALEKHPFLRTSIAWTYLYYASERSGPNGRKYP